MVLPALCPHGGMSSQKWLPPASVSPEGVSAASCLSGTPSKISKCSDPGSFQTTASVLSLGMRVCVRPLRAEPMFPTALQLSQQGAGLPGAGELM